MRFLISAKPLPPDFPYYAQINAGATEEGCSPLLAGAIAWEETLRSRDWLAATYGEDAAHVISGDGGHGIFQLTQSYPTDWADPEANTAYACTNFIIPAMEYWNKEYGYTGLTLVRCVAAEFNAGRQGAENGHLKGDVGMYTTPYNGLSYSDNVAQNYTALDSGELPE